mmetsp:Transcript_32582/g.87480  ORF Transcript_32582/g.87480 Transcript_32582/m.87480 type:complete len:264 (-) Transcript_32582:874-1665(-)
MLRSATFISESSARRANWSRTSGLRPTDSSCIKELNHGCCDALSNLMRCACCRVSSFLQRSSACEEPLISVHVGSACTFFMFAMNCWYRAPPFVFTNASQPLTFRAFVKTNLPPESNSNMVAPKAQTSPDLVAFFTLYMKYSGALYRGSPEAGCPTAVAQPKSAIIHRGYTFARRSSAVTSRSSKMFSGFRSLWQMPLPWCRKFTPVMLCFIILARNWKVIWKRFCWQYNNAAKRSFPLQSSMTMYTFPSMLVKSSSTRTMFG